MSQKCDQVSIQGKGARVLGIIVLSGIVADHRASPELPFRTGSLFSQHPECWLRMAYLPREPLARHCCVQKRVASSQATPFPWGTGFINH